MPKEKIYKSIEMLSSDNLSIGYQAKGGNKIVMSELNLKLFSGQLVALLGPNGSGKSTLIRTLCNLQPQLSGEINFINANNKTSLSWKDIAVVLTSPVYAPNFTVYDMVSAGRYPFTNWLGKLSSKDHTIVEHSIKSVGIEQLAARLVNQLSDGERQRMMIAKALAQQSSIIILDEPTAHLDLINRVEITKLLRKLALEENKAILMATHELDLAIQSADRLWLMDDKEIIVGAPEDMIISGDLQRIFARLSLDFDHYTGAFKIKTSLDKTISFINKDNSPEEIWTERALQKLGFEIINNLDEKIILVYCRAEEKWILEENSIIKSFGSLAELCDELKAQ